MNSQILVGDNLASLRKLAADGVLVDSVVTDPPYGLSFMGKKWDYDVPTVEFWRLVCAVLKPGGHVLSFGGTRTYHRMACAIEDAGFEIRDQLLWIHSQGFPKSLDVSKAIDKAAGAKRAVIGKRDTFTGRDKVRNTFMASPREMPITAPATSAAREWAGYGTALKPACEPIALARKPLDGKNTVASNVLAFRTGALNIDGCRIPLDSLKPRGGLHHDPADANKRISLATPIETFKAAGRWPANVLLDEEAGAILDKQSGTTSITGNRSERSVNAPVAGTNWLANNHKSQEYPGDSGGASRFFYCAKASARERAGSTHPTVKPVALMRYLCRLITPPGGTVLDPFAGSGTTGEAALLEGFSVILMEREHDYTGDIETRLARARIAA